jgi:hypothetical protein
VAAEIAVPIKCPSNGKTGQCSRLVPGMIEPYATYEGRGTPYHLEPKQIWDRHRETKRPRLRR